jgi:hypothetical protein
MPGSYLHKDGYYYTNLFWGYQSNGYVSPNRIKLPAGTYTFAAEFVGNGAATKTITTTLNLSTPTTGKTFQPYMSGQTGGLYYQGGLLTEKIVFSADPGFRGNKILWFTPNTTTTTMRLTVPSGSSVRIIAPSASNNLLYTGWSYDDKGQYYYKTITSGSQDWTVPAYAANANGIYAVKHQISVNSVTGPMSLTILS